MGISWGGVITSTVIGMIQGLRLRSLPMAAAPVRLRESVRPGLGQQHALSRSMGPDSAHGSRENASAMVLVAGG